MADTFDSLAFFLIPKSGPQLDPGCSACAMADCLDRWEKSTSIDTFERHDVVDEPDGAGEPVCNLRYIGQPAEDQRSADWNRGVLSNRSY